MADLETIGNENLSKLTGSIYLQLRDHLDVSHSPSQGWRAFVAVLGESYTL